MKKYTPIKDYINYNDLLQKLGYKEYQPKLGDLGRAIIEASRCHRSIGWLKSQLDIMFDGIRKNKKNNNGLQKQNSRHNLRPNAQNHK